MRAAQTAMVRMARSIEAVRTVQLLGEQHAHQAVRQRHRRQRDDGRRVRLDVGCQAVRAADHERNVVAAVAASDASRAAELPRRPCRAALIERHDTVTRARSARVAHASAASIWSTVLPRSRGSGLEIDQLERPFARQALRVIVDIRPRPTPASDARARRRESSRQATAARCVTVAADHALLVTRRWPPGRGGTLHSAPTAPRGCSTRARRVASRARRCRPHRPAPIRRPARLRRR